MATVIIKNITERNRLIKGLEIGLEAILEKWLRFSLSAKISYNGKDIILDESQVSLLEHPFEASYSYLEILKGINGLISAEKGNSGGAGGASKKVLYQYFKNNITEIFQKTIKKSLGDYSQELSTIARWAGDPDKQAGYSIANKIVVTDTGIKHVPSISLPYNIEGNSFRLLVANDRPSALRGIFLITQGQEKTINEAALAGYYGSKWNKDETVDMEKGGKSFLVKGDMTIPGQLPKYITETYIGDKRVPRKDLKGNSMMWPPTGSNQKPMLGYNTNDLFRWREAMLKTLRKRRGATKTAAAATHFGMTTNLTAVDDLSDDSDDSDDTDDDDDHSGDGASKMNTSSDATDANEAKFQELKTLYQPYVGGRRKKTRRRKKFISKNRTLKSR